VENQNQESILGDTYNYELLQNEFSEFEIKTYRTSLLEQYSKLTKKWTDELHSEWTARMFLAAKMIYSSTLLLNTLHYSLRKNLKIVQPYLLYYSLLNCCRCLTFTLPSQLWKNGELLVDNHSKISYVTSDCVKRLNIKKGTELQNLITNTRDFREFFSYRFPGKGLKDEPQFSGINIETITNKCKVLSEISQFNSECFEQSYNKNCEKETFSLKENILELCFTYTGDNLNIIDDEDIYRIAYIFRNQKRPYNIYYTMTDGMTDDFFGSWLSEEEEDNNDSFNPDERPIKIFEFHK
jgi:hypothetical protein